MDRMGWVINWSAPLIPDPDCVPGDDVFLEGSGQYSLTASSRETPGLLLVSPNVLLKCAHQTVRKKKKKRRRKTLRNA